MERTVKGGDYLVAKCHGNRGKEVKESACRLGIERP